MLDAHPGLKAIYWEREAISPVNLIIGHSLLKVGLCFYSLILYQALCPILSTITDLSLAIVPLDAYGFLIYM